MIDVKSASAASRSSGVIPLHLTLNILDATDGKDELANVAMDLYECVRDQTEEEMELEAQEDAIRRAQHDANFERGDFECGGAGNKNRESFPPATGQGQNEAKRRIRTLLLDRIDARKVDQALAERGSMGEPELLLIHGGPRRISLHGFPPWSLRLTEL